MLVGPRRRQRKLQKLSATQRKFCCCFNLIVSRECFGPCHDLILAPNDQVSPALGYAAFLCMPHKIVESIQGALQLSIRKYTGQARYRQPKQQHEYEYGEDNLDQRKTPQPLHRRTYSIDAKSQHVGNRSINDENPNNDCGSRSSNRAGLKRAAAFWLVPSAITRLRQGYVVAGPPCRQPMSYRPNIDAGTAASCSLLPGGPPNSILNPAITNTSTSGESEVVPRSGARVIKLQGVG